MKRRRSTRRSALEFMFVAITFGSTLTAVAVPIPNDDLAVTAVMLTGDELGGPNSNYNPRHFADSNFVLQINATNGTVRYPAGSDDPASATSLMGEREARMWSPMNGGTSTDWVLLAGGANEPQFSRLPYDAEDVDNRIFAGAEDHEPNSFDWVDDDTIVYTSYEFRDTIYLADVTVEPFDVTVNTTWNAAGAIATDAGRIRNVRVGDSYNSHAYYAEAAVESDARVWALDLSTGESTVVAEIEDVTGDGSWGLWTAKEVDGYLYVHTSHDGIYSYEMQDATTVGELSTHYTKEELDELMLDAGGTVSPNWGFDVAKSGSLMLLGGNGTVIEMSIDVVVAPGDIDGDGSLGVTDIDALAAAIRDGLSDAIYDSNGDGSVTDDDRVFWVKDLSQTWFGDANLDGEFNSGDLVTVFSAGQYEDGIPLNSGWGTGDWNGDGDFDTGDLVTAFSDGGFEQGPRGVVNPVPVPEPSSWAMLFVAGLVAANRLTASQRRLPG